MKTEHPKLKGEVVCLGLLGRTFLRSTAFCNHHRGRVSLQRVWARTYRELTSQGALANTLIYQRDSSVRRQGGLSLLRFVPVHVISFLTSMLPFDGALWEDRSVSFCPCTDVFPTSCLSRDHPCICLENTSTPLFLRKGIQNRQVDAGITRGLLVLKNLYPALPRPSFTVCSFPSGGSQVENASLPFTVHQRLVRTRR